MIFNNLGDVLYIIHALESINTSICITNTRQEIVYQSSRKNIAHNLAANDVKRVIETLQQSQNANFKIQMIDDWITAITSVTLLIGSETYLLEFKQFISSLWHFNTECHNFDNMSIHQIKEMAITDSLTKLYNRRYIDERLPIDMQSSFELDKPISILFIDIDYFKKINDKNGHVAGDQILQDLALLLQKQFNKENGWVARYGGDEILICLPGCTNKVAKRMAHRLRKTIEKTAFRIAKSEVTITCSIGVKTILRDSGVTNISELMIMADKNLYQAKQEGRNKVV